MKWTIIWIQQLENFRLQKLGSLIRNKLCALQIYTTSYVVCSKRSNYFGWTCILFKIDLPMNQIICPSLNSYISDLINQRNVFFWLFMDTFSCLAGNSGMQTVGLTSLQVFKVTAF